MMDYENENVNVMDYRTHYPKRFSLSLPLHRRHRLPPASTWVGVGGLSAAIGKGFLLASLDAATRSKIAHTLLLALITQPFITKQQEKCGDDTKEEEWAIAPRWARADTINCRNCGKQMKNVGTHLQEWSLSGRPSSMSHLSQSKVFSAGDDRYTLHTQTPSPSPTASAAAVAKIRFQKWVYREILKASSASAPGLVLTLWPH